MLAAADATVLSILPAVVAIVLAFTTRQVLPALFFGVMTGSVVLLIDQPGTDANPITRFFFPALGSQGFAKILLIYLWCLGGLTGIWAKTGGAQHFAERVGTKFARGPRSARFLAWLLGVVFHQGGTISTVLAGTTAKPIADRHRVSHEELSYVVDSTASPVATVLPFNAWPAYVATFIVGTIPALTTGDPAEEKSLGATFFFDCLIYNFYGLFAVLATLLFALDLLPWVGRRMARARERARATGALDAPDSEPMLMTDAESIERLRHTGYQPSLADFIVPIAVLLSVAIVPYALYRMDILANGDWVSEAFALAVLSAMAVARVRGMPLRIVLDGFVQGCGAVTVGALILGLAVTIGHVSKELHTADFVVNAIASGIPAWALPAALTFVTMSIAFATGTSWGTYAVVLPVAMPLAWAVQPELQYTMVCFGAVIGGSVFGDQCSPISDTTILSSMFTGCDLLDHVRTQIPLAFSVATLAAAASTVCVL